MFIELKDNVPNGTTRFININQILWFQPYGGENFRATNFYFEGIGAPLTILVDGKTVCEKIKKVMERDAVNSLVVAKGEVISDV